MCTLDKETGEALMALRATFTAFARSVFVSPSSDGTIPEETIFLLSHQANGQGDRRGAILACEGVGEDRELLL